MDTKNYLPSRRGFLKGLAVGAGGYALGSFLIHPNEVWGQSFEDYLGKFQWKSAGMLPPVD